MKILTLVIIYLCWFAGSVKATGQVAERIIIGHDTLSMLACPLERDSILSQQVHKRLTGKNFSTALGRGYIGLWRLEKGKLLLEELREDNRPVDLSGIFDSYLEDGHIVARWFSGDICVVNGECILYHHQGFARSYESETVYTLVRGVVTAQRQIHNSRQPTTNEYYNYTINMLFNGTKMKWKKDSSLNVNIFPNSDGTTNRVEVTSSWSKMPLEKQEAKWKKWKERREAKPKKKYKNIFEKRFFKVRKKEYGARHPYTREVTACAALMDGWEVLTLDGEIQPIRVKIRWGEDMSESSVITDWNTFRTRVRCLPDSLVMDSVVYHMDAFPLQYDPQVFAPVRSCLKGAFTTKNPRGYRASWKIADDWLWLTEVRNARTGELIPLAVLFPGNDGSPVKASWYTGTFEITTGGIVRWSYNTRRRKISCEVKEGRIVRCTEKRLFPRRPGERPA